MNLRFYFEKLLESDEFRKFRKENPESYLSSAFVVIDKEGKEKNKVHFDFFVPLTNSSNPATAKPQPPALKKEVNNQTDVRGKMFSFQLEENCKKVQMENLSQQDFARLDENIDFNFEEIEKIISEKMANENIKNKIQKIIFSLQKLGKKNFLIGTVFISGFGLVKINIDLEDKKVSDFEKKSFFDMLNIFRKKKD
jgi:hypothetical protein